MSLEQDKLSGVVSGEWSGIWEVLGCKWTFHIIRLLDADARHFNAIKNSIDGLPGSTLSARLGELQEHEIISRTVMDSTPPTVEYALTEKGCEVAAVADQLARIERKWDE